MSRSARRRRSTADRRRAPQGSRPAVSVYVRDVTAVGHDAGERASNGTPPDGSSYDAAISGDGRYVAFVSEATDLVRDDETARRTSSCSMWRRRRTELVSRSEGGGTANGTSRQPGDLDGRNGGRLSVEMRRT